MTYLATLAAQALARAEADRADAEQAAAAAAEREAREASWERLQAEARAHLTDVLGAEVDAEVLHLEDVDVAERLVVLTDGAVHLAVTRGGVVALVEPDDDAWTRLADVDSLAALGRALAELDR